MSPTQPPNRIDSKNSNNSGRTVQILTKDGLRPAASSTSHKKKSNPGFVAMDAKKVEGIRESSGISNPLFVRGGRSNKAAADGSLNSMEDMNIDNSDGSATGVGRDVGMKSVVSATESGNELNSVVNSGGGFDNSNGDKDELENGREVQEDVSKFDEAVVGRNGEKQRSDVEKLKVSVGTEQGQGGSGKTWSEILRKKDGDKRIKFDYHSPDFSDGKVIIKPPLQVDVQGRKVWEKSLVGYFFEKRVAFHVMQYNAKRRWARRGLLDVIMNDEGFFFFKFSNEQDLLAVLEEEGLSRIGSGVGKILMEDSLTEQICNDATGRLSFTKLLVEADANRKLPDSLVILIHGENGINQVEVSLRIEYQWRPSWCNQCTKFGHTIHSCPVVAIISAKEQQAMENGRVEKPVIEGGDQEFTFVQRKGKERMVDNNRGDQKSRRGGMGYRNQSRAASRGVVIRDGQEKFNKAVPNKVTAAPGTGEDLLGEDRSLGEHRAFGSNSSGPETSGKRRRGDLPLVNLDSVKSVKGVEVQGGKVIKGSEKDLKTGEENSNRNMGFVNQSGTSDVHKLRNSSLIDGLENRGVKNMSDLLTERVMEYVTSGSKMSPEELVVLEQRIDNREKAQHQNISLEIISCGMNQERDFLSDLDDTDKFMMQGVKNQEVDGECEDWSSDGGGSDNQ
ncbi:hypothetical protein AgCh_034195 [Apium graveolens]